MSKMQIVEKENTVAIKKKGKYHTKLGFRDEIKDGCVKD
jgi:hypothetical protein